MDPNVSGLAKLLIRGRRINGAEQVTYAPYERDAVIVCDFFKAVIRSHCYTAERKNQFAQLLVLKAKYFQGKLPKEIDKKDERYTVVLIEMEKVILKFLRTYPPRYTKLVLSSV